MRKLFLICFSFLAFSIYGQQLPSGVSASQAAQSVRAASEAQLKSYIAKAKSEGYTLTQVKGIIRAQGASLADIALLEDLWNQPVGDDTVNLDTTQEISSNFGLFQAPIEEADPQESLFTIKRFGSDYFTQAREAETPELYLATPSDYQLGPGDEILIELYGASEESYPLQISREGTIKVERLAPVYLSGLSIAAAKARLEARFSKIYTGLSAASNDPAKVTLSVSLLKARSVVVNITGQVVSPGTYTLSGFTSVLNALYAAGGPNNVGSYRSVRLVRGGKLFREIDLYDFFVSGKLPSVYLQDQDVLQIPAYKAQVELSGAFKTPGFYELKANETLSDVLAFSGGFLSDGYKERVFINRVAGFKRQSLTVETVKGASELLEDGDVITASLVAEAIENTVTIEGAVYVPGSYSLESVSTVQGLIEVANGLSPTALPTKALLYRRTLGVETNAISIDLNNESFLGLSLTDGDRLFIPSVEDLTDLGTIQVIGAVNSPGSFEYKNGMRLSDALILAEGFTAEANAFEVVVYHSGIDRNSGGFSSVISVSEELISSENVALGKGDLVVVRVSSAARAIEKVTLDGYVQNRGVYALKGSNYRLYDLLSESGGFLEEAYLPGISVSRKVIASGSNKQAITNAIEKASENSTALADEEFTDDAQNAQLEEIEEGFITIGIDGDALMRSKGADVKNNIVLQDGDVITVPKLDNTVTILGQVQQSAKVSYRSGLSLSAAIKAAGGYSDKAKKSKVYVVYQNGSIKSRATAFLGLVRLDPKLEPGATVVVPEALPKANPLSFGDVVGVTTSLTTLALLISRLGL